MTLQELIVYNELKEDYNEEDLIEAMREMPRKILINEE